MYVNYDFYTDEQGFVGTVTIEVDDDATEDDIFLEIADDLACRQTEEAWEDDIVWGIYKGETITPDEG